MYDIIIIYYIIKLRHKRCLTLPIQVNLPLYCIFNHVQVWRLFRCQFFTNKHLLLVLRQYLNSIHWLYTLQKFAFNFRLWQKNVMLAVIIEDTNTLIDLSMASICYYFNELKHQMLSPYLRMMICRSNTNTLYVSSDYIKLLLATG